MRVGITGELAFRAVELHAALSAVLARHDAHLDLSDGAGSADLVVDAATFREHGLDTLPLRIDGELRSHRTPPTRREHYGDDHDQHLRWHDPIGHPNGAVAVLVHGGFYRSRWDASLMTGLAADLASRGWAVANLEYRRPDRAGWDATVADVHAGVDAAMRLGMPTALIGHSAGGQLVLQAAQRRTDVALAASLAGVVDLDAAHDRFLGEGAVGLALGDPAHETERYDHASPARWGHREAQWLLVQGRDDSADLVEMNRALASRADLGAPELMETPGDHFAVIDPDAAAWHRARVRIESLVGTAAPHPLDLDDPAPERDAFMVPVHEGEPVAYLAANALGLQSNEARDAVVAQLDVWRDRGHAGHYGGDLPWTRMTDAMREPMGRLVGALPGETLAANGLSVNLHLLMASFYRPSPTRGLILMESHAFPSDRFAVRSHLAWHGRGEESILEVSPRTGEHMLRTEDVLAVVEERGDEIALVMLGGVNYLTGELLDIPVVTAAAQAKGAVVGWDLAHAVGNVELALHEWGVDWAAWCSYKYLNGGPGALAGLFVHARHHGDDTLPRLAGWFGQRVEHRFGAQDQIISSPDAEAWQISNPAILALAPVLASVRMFDRHGMEALAARGRRLSEYLEQRLNPLVDAGVVEVLTPHESARRGAQLSLRLPGRSSADVVARLEHEHGVVADARTPDILRLAPAALQTTYGECDRTVAAVTAVLTS